MTRLPKVPKEEVKQPQQLKIFCHRQLWGTRGDDELEDSDSEDEEIDPNKGSALHKLDIGSNRMRDVPLGLPCLAPNLATLILSNNSITEIPSLSLFPASLGTLDLSHNALCHFRPFPDDSATYGSRCYSNVEGQRPTTRARTKTESTLGMSGRVRFCRHARHHVLAQLKRLDLNNNKLQDFSLTLPGQRMHSSSTDSTSPRLHTAALNKHRKAIEGQRTRVLFPSLQSLNLSHNPMSSLPQQIGLLSKLGSLHISHTEITRLPTEAGLLSELWDLQYQGIQLQDIEPSVLERKKTKDVVGYLRSVLEK